MSVRLLLLLPVWIPLGPAHASRRCSEPSPQERSAEIASGADAAPRGGAGWQWVFAPAELLYPTYIADPRRPTFALTRIDARESEIDAAGDSRYGIRMGTRLAVLQLHPPGEPGGGLQLTTDIGMLAQFDRDNSTDNLGWDGFYGFHLAWQARPDFVLRVGTSHDSSHLGDEYIETTGRQRIEYTREEFLAGARYSPLASLASYAEYGWAYDLRNEDLMEKGRVQLGLEFEPEAIWWDRRLAPYAALDVGAYEEDDWEENLTLQAGVVRHAAGGTWRFGAEYYDGRSTIGEFFQEEERHLAWGIWFDP